MTVIETANETQQEKECFDRVLAHALTLDEVRVALERFPQQDKPDPDVAVNEDRANIWLQVAPLRQKVRELEARQHEIERRIGATDPQVAAKAADIERELRRLVRAWDIIQPEAGRLGSEIHDFDPGKALQDIRHDLEDAKRTGTPVPDGISSTPTSSAMEPDGRTAPGITVAVSR